MLFFLLGDIDYHELCSIDEHYSCAKFSVFGNHDYPDYLNHTNITSLHEKVLEWNGLTLAGFGGCPRYKRGKFGQYSEEEVASFLNSIPKIDIFIAHSNPMWVDNFDPTDPHRGFLSFRNFIENNQVKSFFHGHLHEFSIKKIRESTVHAVYPNFTLNF